MTGPDWDAFRDTIRDTHTDAFAFPAVEVINFDGGYDPATGETDNWTEQTPYPTVQMEVTKPLEATITTGPNGQEANVDHRFRLRDDESVTIHAIEDEGHRPTELLYDNKRYVVAESLKQDDGLRLLIAVRI